MKKILRIHVSLLVVLAIAPGCGDDDSGDAPDAAASADAPQATPDAGTAPDAEPPDAGPLVTDECPTSYGLTAVSSTFEVAEGAVGFDLNGDDVIDNILGNDSTVRTIVGNSFRDSLADGSLRTLAELRDFGGVGSDDADLSLVVYGGVDSDDPAVLTDDFDGDEDYYFSHDWVEAADCAPKAATTATYTSGVVEAQGDRISFFVPSFGTFLIILRPRIRATIEADTEGYRTIADTPAVIGGAIDGCSLAKGTTTLGDNAQHALVILTIQPDIDIDGDGLEEIVGTFLYGIEKCIDGDGTEIIGPLCGCDPRMKDGYSITFISQQVGATLLGPAPE